jgi:hypothetical protein
MMEFILNATHEERVATFIIGIGFLVFVGILALYEKRTNKR